MARTFVIGTSGADVTRFHEALNREGRPRFHPTIAEDGTVGVVTLFAFDATGWATGLGASELDPSKVTPEAQELVLDPSKRKPRHLQAERERVGKLHSRTVAIDGAPTFWGLAKPLVRARGNGWTGSVASSDRRPGVPERLGKKSQKTLYWCYEQSLAHHFCPQSCGGDCSPANPPGRSSHELRSDGSAFPGPFGRRLHWWELGIDVSNSAQLMQVLGRVGYHVRKPYPGTSEDHHINFTKSPGRVLGGPVPHEGAVNGPDVSLNQDDVNCRRVRAAGYEFAIAKVTDGLRGTPHDVDPTFTKGRVREMHDAGLIVGYYHFARPQPGRSAKAEAEGFVKTVREAGGFRKGDLIPALDIEKTKLGPAQTFAWIREWVDTTLRLVGRRPFIYTNPGVWRTSVGDPQQNLSCALWLAHYDVQQPTVPRAWRNWEIWQYTEHGSADGIGPSTDMNKFHGTLGALKRHTLS